MLIVGHAQCHLRHRIPALYAQCHYAECHYDECHCDEWNGNFYNFQTEGATETVFKFYSLESIS